VQGLSHRAGLLTGKEATRQPQNTERHGASGRSPPMRMELIEQAVACRKKAAECEHRALRAQDETYRRTYRELAQLWREMAQQAEMLTQKILQP
jgi:hypothetical protein